MYVLYVMDEYDIQIFSGRALSQHKAFSFQIFQISEIWTTQCAVMSIS